MTKRKIVLLSLIAIFAALYIIQLTQIGKNDVTNITVDEDITAIRISKAGTEGLTYFKQVIPETEEAESQVIWTVDGAFQVETFPLTRMADQLSDIRVLGKVSTIANKEQYDLQDENARIIEALNGQNVLRTIAMGKASTTTSQTYAIIDNSKDIVLVSGDLHDIFGKSLDELLLKEELYTGTADEFSGLLDSF